MQTKQEGRKANNQILVPEKNLANYIEFTEVNWFKNQRENVLEMYNLLPKTWLMRIYFYELLLIIGELDGDPRYGITDYFEMLKTRNCTTKTLSTFLNGRIADGDLVSVPSLKQSRRTYKLNVELKKVCESLTLMPSYDQDHQE
tara:strand:- start:65 stop:496 length:432 start_codon:yes stop_codon:yes gene_type:complete